MDSMLVLDTTMVAPSDRAEAVQSAVSVNCTRSAASFEDSSHLQAEMHLYDLGAAKIFNIEASGTTLRRTRRMAVAMNECPIALALPLRTQNRLTRDRDDQLFDAAELMLVDLSAPYVYGWSGAGASYAFHVDFDHLGLPMDTIREASRELRRSPLYPLVRDHITYVMTRTQELLDSGTADNVSAASVELMQALILTAAHDSARTPQVMHTTRASRVEAYVRQHLRDVDLSPAKIAHANGLSLRALYQLYESRGASLEQTIIDQRLAGAHRDLTSAGHAHRRIGAIARAWGFTNPSFFSHRYRQTYGAAPRQLRGTASTDQFRTRDAARTGR